MIDHGIILAAGASSRMGEPKALLAIDGRTLVRRAVEAVRRAGATPHVVLGAHADRVEADIRDVETIRNHDWTRGMSSSLRRGVRSLPKTAHRALVLTVDQPDVDADLLTSLLDACNADHLASACRYRDGSLGVPACFRAELFSELEHTSGDRGARQILRSGQWPVAAVEAPEKTTDVDTAEQWSAYRARRRGAS